MLKNKVPGSVPRAPHSPDTLSSIAIYASFCYFSFPKIRWSRLNFPAPKEAKIERKSI